MKIKNKYASLTFFQSSVMHVSPSWVVLAACHFLGIPALCLFLLFFAPAFPNYGFQTMATELTVLCKLLEVCQELGIQEMVWSG